MAGMGSSSIGAHAWKKNSSTRPTSTRAIYKCYSRGSKLFPICRTRDVDGSLTLATPSHGLCTRRSECLRLSLIHSEPCMSKPKPHSRFNFADARRPHQNASGSAGARHPGGGGGAVSKGLLGFMQNMGVSENRGP